MGMKPRLFPAKTPTMSRLALRGRTLATLARRRAQILLTPDYISGLWPTQRANLSAKASCFPDARKHPKAQSLRRKWAAWSQADARDDVRR
jgi:hypothetical protein